MDASTTFLRRLVRRIPSTKLQAILSEWDHLSREQLLSLDFKLSKAVITELLLCLFEENGLTVKHIAELEMIYVIDNPNHWMWNAFHLVDAGDEAHSMELTQFRTQFKVHLTQLISHVSIKIKKNTDEAIWIRVAWGDNFTRPNQLKPTYIVHYLQTPYYFVSSLTEKHKPLLNQAMALATGYSSVKDANLSGRKLMGIRGLLMKQYQQAFPTMYPHPFQENNPPPKNPNIIEEQAANAENRLQMACEAFGKGTLPELQTATYKLETRYRDNTNNTMTDGEEPFRCVVKFASTNLLESLRHCVSSGMAAAPVTPLLSSITQKGRNYFVITDKGVGPSSQTPHPKN